jgi:hypothetical protein
LRQQQEARLKTILRNIEMVSEAEWELFWAYTGGQVVKAGVRGFKAWRLARAAAIPFKGRLNPFTLEPTHKITMGRNKFARFKAKLAREGIREPIKFVSHDGKRYVVDGHHRLRAAKELGMKDVPVEEVQLPFGGYSSPADLIP